MESESMHNEVDDGNKKLAATIIRLILLVLMNCFE